MVKPVKALQEAALQLQEIQNPPLRLRIADTLREAILRGDFKPGQALTEANLAAQLQVSRAPVREAMRVLAEEGLIETIPYKGTVVRNLSRKDIEEVYSLRELLEAFAVRRILAAAEPLDLSELERICQDMQGAAQAQDTEKLNREDERFHRTLIGLARHDLLSSMWTTLFLRVRQIMALRNQQNQNPMEVALNHPPIVGALRARNEARALALIHQHVHSAADLSIDYWEEENG